MLGSWIGILVVYGALIVSEVYFIGKYIGIRHEIFASNFFAQLALGTIVYFCITFAVFLPLIWLEANFVIFVVFFFIKDAFQIGFLITRRKYLKTWLRDLNKLAFIIISAIALTFFYNEALGLIRPLSKGSTQAAFAMWEQFKKMIYRVGDLPSPYVETWFAGGLVALLGLSIITGMLSALVHRTSVAVLVSAVLLMLGSLMAFNFERPLESLAGNYLLLFAILNALNIIRFSRRRYGALFGVTALASWAFDPNYFLSMLVLAFISATYYVLLRKPKPILFWIQMMAPLAVVSTLWLNEVSRPAGVVLTVLAIGAYAFMISVGRLESLVKLDQIINKLRIITPSVILLIILGASLALGLSRSTETVEVIKNQPFLFDDYDNIIAQYTQYALLALVALSIGAQVIVWIVKPRDWSAPQQAGIVLIGLAILFAVNPGFVTLINQVEILKNQQIYLTPLVLPTLSIIVVSLALNKAQQKLLPAARSKKNRLLTAFG